MTVTQIRAGRAEMMTELPSWNRDPLSLAPTPEEPSPDLPATVAADYEEFFRATYADTVRHLVRRGLGPEAAADCSQEAYVRAYARWWRIRHYDDPAAWVRRVATNIAIDVRRRDERAQRALPQLAAERSEVAPAPREPGAFEAISSGLPAQQRRVVELCYGEDLSTEQAAGRMGISAGAVRFHLSRARARLRHDDARLSEESR